MVLQPILPPPHHTHTLGMLLLQVQMAWVGVDARPVHGVAKAGMREADAPRGASPDLIPSIR